MKHNGAEKLNMSDSASQSSEPPLSSPLLSYVRIYLYTSSSNVYGQHDRDNIIIRGSHWEKPAWWSNVLLAGVVLVSMEHWGEKYEKTNFLITLHPLQSFALLYTCASFIRQPLVVIPPWRRSIARLATFQPPKSSSAKMGSQSEKWAGFHTPFLGIREDSWYWNLFDGVHCCSYT